MRLSKLSPTQKKEMREDVRTMLLSQIARKYGVSHQTVLNYLRDEFNTERDRLLAEGKTESEATMKAYEEVYKCRPLVKTIEY